MQTRYGDIHSVSLFGHPVVVLSSLTAVEEFRAASPDNFTHRCNMYRRCKNGDIYKGLDNMDNGFGWIPLKNLGHSVSLWMV